MSDAVDTLKETMKDEARAPVRNLGKRLRQAREAKNLSTNEVAEKLHFPPSRVTFLENDEFERFPAVTYTKGYVRAYATLLGLPVDDIMAELAHYKLEDEVVHRRPEVMVNYQTTTRDWSFRWVSYAVVAVLVVLIVSWWRGTGSDSSNLKAAIPLNSIQTSQIELPGRVDVEA